MVMTELAMAYPLFFIIILALIVTVISTFVHKWLTNQEHLKSLKKRQKEIQKELKKCKDHNLMQELNMEMMKLTGVMFKSSMKPMFVTIIPFLLIFGWANANIAYDPISPNNEFFIKASFGSGVSGNAEIHVPVGIKVISGNVKEIVEIETGWIFQTKKGEALWTLEGDVGEYEIEVLFLDERAVKELVISEGAYYKGIKKSYDGNIEEIIVGNKKRIYLDILGWEIGWLGSYILLSILFSIILRKVLKVA